MPAYVESGKAGYNIIANLAIVLPDGSIARAQFSGNVVLIGSADWPNEAADAA